MNTQRRQLDSSGRQFMPMNPEGGTWDEHFITTPKLVTLGIVAFCTVGLIIYISNNHMSIGAATLLLLFWILIATTLLRFIVFEEKRYYKVYKILQEYEITTPAIFWNISAIEDTLEGAIITYQDSKIGIIIKLDRDTITGKNPEFQEDHYDAVSDFYRELMRDKYSFVQLNIMEKAGSDPRLYELDKLVRKNENPNIQELMQRQIGYIKNLSHNTLYESDYFLIYTSDITKSDHIVNDVIEDVFKILDGAYISYSILKAKDIIELVKEIYGVKYFNYTQATLDMFKMNGVSEGKIFDIAEIEYTDGYKQKIDKNNINVLNRLTSGIANGTLKQENISIKDAMKVRNNMSKNFTSFDEISNGYVADDTKAKSTITNKNNKRTDKFADLDFDFDVDDGNN